jgi:decaprenyl-phosphate phosphoribosyltransferase
MTERVETRPLEDELDQERLAGPAADGRARPEPSVAVGLLRSLRPRQWAKNVLVAAAPAAAGVLTEADVLLDVALGIVAFCLVSSATYLLNDVRDAESDRLHPDKRHRPIAAGAVPPRIAVAVAGVLLVAGLAVALAVNLGFLGIVALYLAITSAYTLWLKHVAVVDIVTIASGFILRACAGGVAAGVPLSRWFVIVATFGSLFVVSGKRHGEHIDLGAEGHEVRPTLGAYSRSYLQYVWTVTSGITLMGYCLWAFEQSGTETELPLFELSILPFLTFMLRYAMLLDQGRGGAPEDLVLGDRALLVLGALWAIVFGLAVQFR